MPPRRRKISLIYFVILTLLLVGLVPLVLTGWFLSDKSGRELRSAVRRIGGAPLEFEILIPIWGERYIRRFADLGLRTLLEGEAAALAATRGTDLDYLKDLEKLCQASYNPRDRGSVVKAFENVFKRWRRLTRYYHRYPTLRFSDEDGDT